MYSLWFVIRPSCWRKVSSDNFEIIYFREYVTWEKGKDGEGMSKFFLVPIVYTPFYYSFPVVSIFKYDTIPLSLAYNVAIRQENQHIDIF